MIRRLHYCYNPTVTCKLFDKGVPGCVLLVPQTATVLVSDLTSQQMCNLCEWTQKWLRVWRIFHERTVKYLQLDLVIILDETFPIYYSHFYDFWKEHRKWTLKKVQVQVQEFFFYLFIFVCTSQDWVKRHYQSNENKTRHHISKN